MNQKFNGIETLLGNAACSGLAATIAILSVGHISGAHINPAVTLAFAALKHFPWAQVPIYIIAQFVGGILASLLLKLGYHPFMSGGGTVPTASFGQAFLLEVVATFFLMFVITAVATDTRAVSILQSLTLINQPFIHPLLIFLNLNYFLIFEDFSFVCCRYTLLFSNYLTFLIDFFIKISLNAESKLRAKIELIKTIQM